MTLYPNLNGGLSLYLCVESADSLLVLGWITYAKNAGVALKGPNPNELYGTRSRL